MSKGYLLDPLYIDFGSTVPVCCSVFYKLGRILNLLSRMLILACYSLKHVMCLYSQRGSASTAEQVVKPQLSANTALLIRGRHCQPFSTQSGPQVTRQRQLCLWSYESHRAAHKTRSQRWKSQVKILKSQIYVSWPLREEMLRVQLYTLLNWSDGWLLS